MRWRFCTTAAVLLFQCASAQAGGLILTCAIQNATAVSDRDPIASISVALDDGKWSVVHKSLGGSSFDRSAQYFIKDRSERREFAWEGMNFKRPQLRMVGTLVPTRSGTWEYSEFIFDENRGGVRTYAMRSFCTAQSSPPKIARASTQPMREWKAENGPLKIFQQGVSVQLSEAKDKDGETIAELNLSMDGRDIVLRSEHGLERAAAKFEIARADPANSKIDVIFTWFSGGAHCCTRIMAASFIDGSWVTADHGFWDGEALDSRPMDVNGDGVIDFVLTDNRFLYAFAPYAESFAPTQIFNLRRGAFIDVTRDNGFHKLFEEDVARSETECKKGANSACATYVAASARLGKFESAWKVMMQSYDRKPDWDYQVCPAGQPKCENGRSTKSLPEALAPFLRQAGYID